MPVRIVTDSTADLPPALAASLGIAVVPLNVHFGDQVFRDGIDISPEEFYRRLASSPQLPKTSQPSVGDFLETYQRLLPGASGIVSVHISAKLSGTWNSATQACGELAGKMPMEVIDSQQVSLGLGLVVLAAARAAQQGASFADVVAEARHAVSQARTIFLVDTLEYLEKGGRIGKAQAFLGGILNIKPILAIHDGEVHPLERARTRARAISRLAELVQEATPLQELAVVHSTTPEDAQALAGRLASSVPGGQVQVAQLGAVVGAYAGPGCLGVGLRRAAAS